VILGMLANEYTRLSETIAQGSHTV